MHYRIHSNSLPSARQAKDRCPRCGGNMIRHGDQYGFYASCLQCGKTVDLERQPARPRRDELAVRWQEEARPGGE